MIAVLSALALNSLWPSAEKLADQTKLAWLVSGGRSGSQSSSARSRTTAEATATASTLPSGEKAQERPASSGQLVRHCQVVRSQICSPFPLRSVLNPAVTK